MTVNDPLVPLVPIRIGETDIVVDEHRPVAAVITGGDIRFVTWPHAPLPDRHSDASTHTSPGGVWVVYEEVEDLNGLTPDSIELDPPNVSSTAVFVGLDGSMLFADLGPRRTGGADQLGLWAVDPRDASTWDGSIRDGDIEDFPDVEDLPVELPGEESDEDFWREGFSVDKNGDWTSIDEWDDGDNYHEDNDDDGDDLQVVMTTGQYEARFSFADDSGQANYGSIGGLSFDSDTDLSDVGPLPLPTPPTEILRLSLDGSRIFISVDHLVDAAAQVGETLYLRVHATGPLHVPAPSGFSRNVQYQPRTVSIDVHDGLPARVVTDELPTVVGWNWDDSDPSQPTLGINSNQGDDDDAWFKRFEEELENDEAGRKVWSDRIDLEGVVDTRWPLIARTPELIKADVDAVRDQFISLPLDHASWWAGDDSMHRQRSDYRNVDIVLEGTWPRDDVVVTFEHRQYPHVRLRHRVRVHDDSGRPFALRYLTVYLDETLATGHVPPLSEAANHVIDV